MLGSEAWVWGDGSMVVFFFSSRRRHTRLQGDWSSDVCSSDLFPPVITTTSPGLTATDVVTMRWARRSTFQIGKASRRERVLISGVAVSLKKKQDMSLTLPLRRLIVAETTSITDKEPLTIEYVC